MAKKETSTSRRQAAKIGLLAQTIERLERRNNDLLARFEACAKENEELTALLHQPRPERVDAEAGIETNATGGRQSAIGVRADLLDGRALLRLSRVLAEGATKYSPNNWRLIGRASHLNHAATHIFNYLASVETDRAHGVTSLAQMEMQEVELDHAFCRLMMAVATRSTE